MKRIISIFISLIIISLSLLTVHAYTPVLPYVRVQRYFKELYAKYDDVDNLTIVIDNEHQLSLGYKKYDSVVLVDFSSKNAEQKPYFNRFGNNNEYYEYSETTEPIFESGLTIFAGLYYYTGVNHDEDFYSLEEVASTNPEIIDEIIEIQITQRVGYIGDADCDGKVTVIDATTIQRHLAQIEALTVELSSDIDDDGRVDITDATMLQLQLAELE